MTNPKGYKDRVRKSQVNRPIVCEEMIGFAYEKFSSRYLGEKFKQFWTFLLDYK